MIRIAREEEKQIIEKQWREIFAHDDHGHSDFYFKLAYQANQSYVLANDQDEIIACCQVHTHTLDFNGKPLQASFIVGVYTLPSERNKGYMKQLLTEVIDICSHKDLFTLIQAYLPNLYTPYGFEKVYQRQTLILQANQIPVMSPMGVSSHYSTDQLYEVYQKFTSHFTGYIHRSKLDFTHLQQEVSAQQGKILTYQKNGIVEAYACVFAHTDIVEVDELVYENATALLSILSALSNLQLPLHISVSIKEDLKKILPMASFEVQDYTSVRLNDVALFNELFKVHVKSAQEAFLLAKKPLWLRENQ